MTKRIRQKTRITRKKRSSRKKQNNRGGGPKADKIHKLLDSLEITINMMNTKLDNKVDITEPDMVQMEEKRTLLKTIIMVDFKELLSSKHKQSFKPFQYINAATGQSAQLKCELTESIEPQSYTRFFTPRIKSYKSSLFPLCHRINMYIIKMDELIKTINKKTGNSMHTITDHIGISEPEDKQPFKQYTTSGYIDASSELPEIPQYTLEELEELKINYENRENNKEHDPEKARLYEKISLSGQNLSNEQRYGSSLMSNVKAFK